MKMHGGTLATAPGRLGALLEYESRKLWRAGDREIASDAVAESFA
jgi:hypothetical protein